MEYLVYDLVILVVLVLFTWRGWRKGLLLSLCGLAVVLLSLLGANVLADTLDDPAANAIQPALAVSIQESIDAQMEAQPEPSDADPIEALRGMGGLYEWAADALGEAQETMSSVLLDTVQSVAQAAARAIAVQTAHTVIFALAFVLLFILLTLLLHALDLVAKLPGLHFCNGLGGGLIGLVKGVLILYVVIACLQLFGKLITPQAVENTYLLKLFARFSPLSSLFRL